MSGKLIHIVDAHGKTHYVNPDHIMQIEEVRADRCRVRFTEDLSFDVDRPAHDIYGLITSLWNED